MNPSHWIPDVTKHGEFLVALIDVRSLPVTVVIDLAIDLAVIPPKPFHWMNNAQDDLVARVSKRNRDDFTDFIRAVDASTGVQQSFWHFHIRKNREYLFQADDTFKRDFIRVDSNAVDEPWLHDLQKRGIINSYVLMKGKVG